MAGGVETLPRRVQEFGIELRVQQALLVPQRTG